MITVLTLNPSIDRSYYLTDFKIGQVQRSQQVIATAGGKGLNVARVLRRLGEKVECLGFLGGYTGSFISSEIKKVGLIDKFTQITGTTRICMNFQANDVSTEVLEGGPEITAAEIALFKRTFLDSLEQTSLVVASGSLPKGIPTDFYGWVAEMCSNKNVKFILDASGECLKQAIPHRPYLIKPNEEELAALTGTAIAGEAEVFDASNEILQGGAENICVSMGKRGVCFNGSLGKFTVRIPVVDAKNTVGCGDSLVAGLAFALRNEYDVLNMMKFANACGISNALHEGVGQVERDEVERYADEVSVNFYFARQNVMC